MGVELFGRKEQSQLGIAETVTKSKPYKIYGLEFSRQHSQQTSDPFAMITVLDGDRCCEARQSDASWRHSVTLHVCGGC
jgi:hypothetical protein